MNSEPSEYKSDKKEYVLPVPISNPWAFSVSWTNTPNMNGVNPPNPQFQPAPNIPYILAETIVPAPSENGKTTVGYIESRREPYAVEFYNNPYGLLNSKLGTNLGA
jgi:hypothetical protein